MKILQVNKFFYHRGGAETYFLELSRLLQEAGQEVIFFSQKNSRNLPSNQEKYFVSDLELGHFSWRALFKLPRIFWSREAAQKIGQLIRDEQPEIVHIHNIYHQLSPSILKTVKQAGLPLVMTVHDFKLIKPDYTLSARPARISDWLSAKKLILTAEFFYHQWLNSYQKYIDLFIAPSQFVKDKLAAKGFAPEKIIVAPHFVASDIKPQPLLPVTEKYLLSFGRLDQGKGLDLLLRAFSGINRRGYRLKIAGAGPAEGALKQLTKQLGLADQVDFLGQQNQEQLKTIIAQSLFAVFPSRVHETFGLGVLESLSLGKPVIASRAGAFSELVDHEQTGLLFAVDNLPQLKQALAELMANPEKTKAMGLAAQKKSSQYSAGIHCQKIIQIYQQLIKNS